MYQVTVKKGFSAAHMLKEIGGKCENLHGHNFTVAVTVASERLNAEGLVVDFRLLKEWLGEVLGELDHRCLNEVSWLEGQNPSAENLAKIIFQQLSGRIRQEGLFLQKVVVGESDNSEATYEQGPG
jgi:6-pyruvoyltetrahydropterin/6-carboxytetrahydropterin synthase